MGLQKNYYHLIAPFVLCAGLVALPFVYWPQGLVVYEVPKVWFLWRFIELLLISALVGGLWQRRIRMHIPLMAMLTIWVAVGIAASFMGVDWTKSVWGNYYRQDGLLTWFHLIGLAVWVACFWQPVWMRLVKAAVTVSVAVLVLGMLFGYFRLDGAPFGHPIFWGGWIAVSLPFLMGKRWWQHGLLGIAVVIVLLSQAVGAWLTVLFCGALLFGFYVKARLRMVAAMVALIVMVVVVGWYWQQDFSAESRERIFRRSIAGWQQRPWLGWGMANVDYAIESVHWPAPMLHDVYVDKAHSVWLETLVTTGGLGFGVYVLLSGYLGWRLWRKREYRWLLVLLLYMFHSQTNVISIAEEVYFWLALGVGLREG
jgi:hypothetical protein